MIVTVEEKNHEWNVSIFDLLQNLFSVYTQDNTKIEIKCIEQK